MRMWRVDPKVLCNKHLVGEHYEMHMFAGSIRLGRSMAGYINRGLLIPEDIKRRHDLLASEMIVRGFIHESPLDQPDVISGGSINVGGNLQELSRRCPKCRVRIILAD
jgi:hypothetical protein